MSPNKRISKKMKQALEQQQQQQQQLQHIKPNPSLDTSKTEEVNKLSVNSDGDLARKADINQMDEKLHLKKEGQYELVDAYESGNIVKTVSVLEMFEQKYSCPFLTLHEAHDIFFSSGKQFNFDEDYNADYDKMLSHDQSETYYYDTENAYKKRIYRKKFQLNSLARYDENNVCKNALKRLYLKSKSNLKDDSSSKKTEKDHDENDERTKVTKSYLKNKLKFKSLFSSNVL